MCLCYLHMFVCTVQCVCLWVPEPQRIRTHARVSERASVQVEQDQEGERKRAEKETEENTERGGFVQWQIVQEQVAIPQEKGGASFHLLIGDLNWLQIGFSLTEDSPACGVQLSPLM